MSAFTVERKAIARKTVIKSNEKILKQMDSQVFTMSQPKRSHRKKQEVAPPPDSDSSDDEANTQMFSISNGGAVVSYRDQLYMLSEVLDDSDEVQELNFQNSSGIRTSARLQAKAWQDMKTHEKYTEICSNFSS